VRTPKRSRREDLEYLRLPASLSVEGRLDLVLSVAARRLLRALAGGLPGFSSSPLPYLRGNFLELTAEVTDEPERRVVRLSRSPLHIILDITGKSRASYRLSWMGERPFVLFSAT
jgi:hypothetical protein